MIDESESFLSPCVAVPCLPTRQVMGCPRHQPHLLPVVPFHCVSVLPIETSQMRVVPLRRLASLVGRQASSHCHSGESFEPKLTAPPITPATIERMLTSQCWHRADPLTPQYGALQQHVPFNHLRARSDPEVAEQVATSRSPLPTHHAAFGQRQGVVSMRHEACSSTFASPLSLCPACSSPIDMMHQWEHPDRLWPPTFAKPVSLSGFFASVQPTWCFGDPTAAGSRMNPNAQLTIRDQQGNAARVKYRCKLLADDRGVKLEAMVRFQVGWINPPVTFKDVPRRILLGRGVDISVPFFFHFTCVNVLDEVGCATGSCLYFSGTPMLGVSLGIHGIRGGELLLDGDGMVDPSTQSSHFFGKVHRRQLGLVALKLALYLACGLCLVAPLVRDTLCGWVPRQLRPTIENGLLRR